MSSKIFLSLAGVNKDRAIYLTETIGKYCYGIKGHDIFDRYGLWFAHELKERGAKRVWNDGKYHDTKDTVTLRANVAKEHGIDIITVHASGGVPMMSAAVSTGLIVYAVTVLSSLDNEECKEFYNNDSIVEQALKLAKKAASAGVDGIVSSPKEVLRLRGEFPKNPLLITPGTRSPGVALGSQKRPETPEKAIAWGSDILVIESEIIKAPDTMVAYQGLVSRIG